MPQPDSLREWASTLVGMASSPPEASLPARVRAHRWFTRVVELMKFGIVGGVAFVIDVGLFNVLRFGPGELLGGKPLTAKVVSVAVATVVAWLGNRYWTFTEQRTSSQTRELVGYALVNIGGMAIAVLCLWVSHYVLDLRSPLADNVSANGIGLVLGTAFRYVGYKRWVFTGR